MGWRAPRLSVTRAGHWLRLGRWAVKHPWVTRAGHWLQLGRWAATLPVAQLGPYCWLSRLPHNSG